MAEFRKKPVVIEAFQWLGSPDQTEDPVWACDAIRFGIITFEGSVTDRCVMHVSTLEGVMRAEVGDWIIRGVKGEIYPCKPDIFAATYTPMKNGGGTEVWIISTMLPDQGPGAWEVNGVFTTLEGALAACSDGQSAAVRMTLDTDYHGVRAFWMATPGSPEPYLVDESDGAALHQ